MSVSGDRRGPCAGRWAGGGSVCAVVTRVEVELAVSTKKDAPAWESGVAIGAVILAILMVFAVGLTKWHKNDLGQSISLPDTLSGGFKAIDGLSYATLPAAQQKQTSQSQFDQSIATLKKSTATESSALTNAFGIAVTSREYISSDFQSEVQATAYRGPGGIFGNGENLANSSTGGPGTGSMQRVGDTICYVDAGSSQTQTSPQAECQRSSDNLTVQVRTTDGKAATASKYADEVYNDIAK